jgi:hypothetical protein
VYEVASDTAILMVGTHVIGLLSWGIGGLLGLGAGFVVLRVFSIGKG